MLVKFDGLTEARYYRGVTFTPGEPVEVSDEWFVQCKNDRVVVAEDKPKRKRRTKAEMAEASAESEHVGTE